MPLQGLGLLVVDVLVFCCLKTWDQVQTHANIDGWHVAIR